MPSPWDDNNGEGNRNDAGGWRNPRRWLWILLGAAGVFLVIRYLVGLNPSALEEDGSRLSIVHHLLWLILIGSSLLLHYRSRPGQALRHIAGWIGIFAVLVVAYSFRHEAELVWQRLTGELVPQRGTTVGEAVAFTAQRNGHFVVEADVEGTPIRFMVDTGASDVVLSPADARRLGYDLDALDFTRMYQTANGTVFGAPVTLDRVTVGPIEMYDVRASVNGADMAGSLLGMSFLSRLSGYEVTDDRLILKP